MPRDDSYLPIGSQYRPLPVGVAFPYTVAKLTVARAAELPLVGRLADVEPVPADQRPFRVPQYLVALTIQHLDAVLVVDRDHDDAGQVQIRLRPVPLGLQSGTRLDTLRDILGRADEPHHAS